MKLDEMPNPGTILANRTLLVKRMIDVAPGAAVKELLDAVIEYYEESQGYIAALWREICALRCERDLLSPYLTGEDWEALANEYFDLAGSEE
jgi:hypothetical protein